MRKIFLAGLFLLIPALLLGQLESDTLNITASRQMSVQPDQALYYVTVVASPSKGLDDVLAAVQSLGITAANFNGLNTLNDGTLEWSFNLPVALAKIQTTVASLVALQQSMAGSNNGMTLTFYNGSLQVSPALAATETCPVTDLVSDARAQAQKLADAAGVSVGPLLSIDTSGYTVSSTVPVYAGVTSLTGILAILSTPAPPVTCSAVVKFRLLRYQ
jgi:uncharacterized protein YggE